ncbi:acyl carrier protein [Psychrobacillus sp. FSL H8-0510]|uniref:acyl carrier protein n=1 Tax=Psychrobacillus sp. FSL H8-0510 TaxID=2921394 RepID=UPI0030F9AC98
MTEEDLITLLKNEFNVHNKFHKDDRLSALGLDSLEIILLIVKLESLLKKSITDKEMENLSTVDDVLQLANEKLLEE